MKDLTQELNELHELFLKGSEYESKFAEKLEYIKVSFTSDTDIQLINEAVDKMMNTVESNLNELSVKIQLAEVEGFLNLAYIAKHYFGKTKNWLYQRLNGYLVNGKKAKFNEEEIEIFNRALSDMSMKLGSLRVH